MSSVFLLIPLALGMLAVAGLMFVWAVRNQQFDDLDSPASRILFDDEALHSSSSRLDVQSVSTVQPEVIVEKKP